MDDDFQGIRSGLCCGSNPVDSFSDLATLSIRAEIEMTEETKHGSYEVRWDECPDCEGDCYDAYGQPCERCYVTGTVKYVDGVEQL